MRRTAAVVLLALSVLGAGLGAPWSPAVAGAPEARHDPPAEVAAISSDSVVESYGVGLHLNFLDTPYADYDAVAQALADLGVRHVRDDVSLANVDHERAAMAAVAARGVGFDLIMGRPDGGATPQDYVDTLARQLPVDAVESLEGVNEWDLNGGDDWVAEMTSWQQALHTAARAEPRTADLPLLSPALAFKQSYAAAGDLSAYADVANAHMYPGGYRPSNEIRQMTDAVRSSVPDGPLVATESGYHDALAGSGDGHRAVPEGVAGVYMPRLLLEHVLRGEARVYTYELLDEFDDPDLTDPEAHFGLLRHDLSPKPAYTAMQSLLSLLADPGPAFTPAPLAVAVDGYPSDARYLLTQRRDGSHVLLLWRDVSIWDPVAQQPQAVAPADVTLRLADPADLTVYRPSSAGVRPVDHASGTSLPLALDGEVTAIAIADPAARVPGRPRIVATTAGAHRITVTWRPADGRGSPVRGYRLECHGRVVTVGPARTRATVKGLPFGRRLRVAVRARNDVGPGRPAYTPYVRTGRPAPG